MTKRSKNPTRKQVEFWLATSPSKLMSDSDNHTARRLAQAYLRALDMRDELQPILEDGYRNEGVSEDGYPYWVANRVAEAIKKFDGGGDD